MEAGATATATSIAGRLHRSQCLYGNRHARSGGDSVIHKNHRSRLYLERRAIAPVESGTAIEHLPHTLCDAFNFLRRDALHPDDLFIQILSAATRNRAEREFLVVGNAKLMR